MPTPLSRYGQPPDEPSGAAPGRLARITRVERGECDVVTEDGPLRVVSDSLRAQSDMAPVTGDWAWLVDDPEVGWRVDQILPRKQVLSRRDPSEEVVEQVLVANVDRVFITAAVDRQLKPGRIERFLVLSWDSGAVPTVVLTKIDLASADELEETRAIISALAPGIDIVNTSAESGEGVEAIRERLPEGSTGVLVGESGAGKSTLVNALLGDDVQEIAEVRASDAAGRHTTITRDLLLVPGGGVLIDTPGIRAVGIWDAEDALLRVFGDIIDRADDCRFNDCEHDREPGCAVTAAVASGEVDPLRLSRYRLMKAELDEQAERQVERERRKDARGQRGGGRSGGRSGGRGKKRRR